MKDIPGYEGRYSITPDGKVYSWYGNKFMKLWLSDRGYLKVQLRQPRRNFRVHRLVAQAYLPNPRNAPKIDHKNGNPTDNRVENLRWCTDKENVHYAIKAGKMICIKQRLLKPHDIYRIKELRSEGKGATQISRELNLSYHAVRDFLRGRNYKPIF